MELRNPAAQASVSISKQPTNSGRRRLSVGCTNSAQRPASLASSAARRFENAASSRSRTSVEAMPHCGTACWHRDGSLDQALFSLGVSLYAASLTARAPSAALVALADPARLSATLREALRRGRLCSTDPMCADHHAGEQSDALHAAACHACLFAPETSCEHGNRYLDRATVTPILGDPTKPYFP